MMSVRLSLDKVLLLVMDNDFGLFEGGRSDEEREGISSYLSDTIVGPVSWQSNGHRT